MRSTSRGAGVDVRAEQMPAEGLTSAEAEARRRRGDANTAVGGTSRSYATILRSNVFSFYNSILFVIGAALLSLGRYSDALISVGLGLINALISAGQEIRAKRKLDRLQLLDRAPVLVTRDNITSTVVKDGFQSLKSINQATSSAFSAMLISTSTM